MCKNRRLKIYDFNNMMEKMASYILKFYEFAKKNPQIKNKNFAIDV